MEKISKQKAEKILVDGGSINVKIKGINTAFKAELDLLKGEVFNMDVFLFKLFQLIPGVDSLPSLEFYVNVEPVKVVYNGRFIIRHAINNKVLTRPDKKIRGYRQLAKYANAHYMKVVNKGFLVPDAKKLLTF